MALLPGAHVQLNTKLKQNEGQSYPAGTRGFVANKVFRYTSPDWYIVQVPDGTFFEAHEKSLILLDNRKDF